MLYIKRLNLEDIEKEYRFLQEIPYDENGYINKYYGVSFSHFKDIDYLERINASKNIGLQEGFVPDTYYFLWENDSIIGLYKVRHYLNELLMKGAGHIGFGIHPNYRQKGYATKGLSMILQEVKDLIAEDEIYMSCFKNNPASYKVQIKNGAYIHHEDEDHYYLRIKKRDIK